ncbi:MAG: hypothetical protein CL843_11095 [Crocinitomicaceae bacterium]|nr:hypothetical protein [Crocinitomicaceae bacterium]
MPDSCYFLKKNFILMLSCFFCLSLSAQVQKGQDIDGEALGDQSGWFVSMPDNNTVAIGATHNDGGNGIQSGHVRVYYWNGTAWAQKGADIDGESTGDWSGYSVSMPNSNTVAIGAVANTASGLDAGHVRVYSWNGMAWVQKGADIDGENSGDWSGYSVSMPNENTVAVGAPFNNDNGTEAGHTRIYSWNGTTWNQKGNDIDGESAGDRSGYSLSMPNENTVAIGAPLNNGNGTEAGHTRIYSWNGTTWVQKGTDIDGESAGDRSGLSVSMSDSTTLAIGAPLNSNGSGTEAGHARIYKWNGTTWVQKGADIDGQAAYDNAGFSVSMPDSNTFAISSMLHSGSSGFLSGTVRIFTWNGSSWTQKGVDIDGEAALDYSGRSVSMSDSNTVAIGSRRNGGNGSYSGHVRVYDLCTPSYSTINPNACLSFTSPSGNYTWTTSDTYFDTLTNTTGCDSIITIHLTLLDTQVVDTITTCDSHTWINGTTYTTSNYTATDTLVNSAGCDSVIALDLTILHSSTFTDTISACYSYTWMNGNTYTSSNNTATDTLVNAVGCDSVVRLDLTILAPSTYIDTVSACNSYTWIDGNTYTTSNTTAMDTLVNTAGCDSIVTLNLTLSAPTNAIDSIAACGEYTWVDGNTYTSSNNSATYILTNSAGCDSIVTLNLSIDTLSVTVSYINNSTLEGEIEGTYEHFEWVECYGNNVYASAAVDSSLLFTPQYDGNYALMVFNANGCIDTSECLALIGTDVESRLMNTGVTLYPNPNNGKFTLKLEKTYSTVSVSVRNTLGQETFAKDYHSTTTIDLELEDNAGIYFIQLKTDDQNHVLKVVKE